MYIGAMIKRYYVHISTVQVVLHNNLWDMLLINIIDNQLAFVAVPCVVEDTPKTCLIAANEVRMHVIHI